MFPDGMTHGEVLGMDRLRLIQHTPSAQRRRSYPHGLGASQYTLSSPPQIDGGRTRRVKHAFRTAQIVEECVKLE